MSVLKIITGIILIIYGFGEMFAPAPESKSETFMMIHDFLNFIIPSLGFLFLGNGIKELRKQS